MTSNKATYASVEEERRWNSLSKQMMVFHQWFKDECKYDFQFKMIYEVPTNYPPIWTLFDVLLKSADGSFTKRGLSLSSYLDIITSFCSHLTMHHTIEERHVFPVLAKKIPKFGHSAQGGHVDSHRAIHDALKSLANCVSKYRNDPTSYSPTEMKTCLDSLSSVLFQHLDQEVEDLRGDQLKPYFTLEEIENISH